MATVAGSLRNKVLVLDDVTTGDLTVTGSVTISGTATTLNSTNTSINDSLIELNAGLTGSNPNDTGLILERGSTGNNVFIGWDESTDKVMVATTTADGTATGNLSLTAANFQAADVTMSSATSSGKITINATEGLEVGGIRGRAIGSQSGDYIHLYERVHIGYHNGWGANVATAPAQGLGTWGGINVGIGGSGVLQIAGTTVIDASRNIITGSNLYFGATNSSLLAKDGANIRYMADGIHKFETYAGAWVERAQITDSGLTVTGSTSLGEAISNMDTSNLKLQVNGHASIKGGNALYFGITTNNYNSWKGKIWNNNTSTMQINAQALNFNNSGYGSSTFFYSNSTGFDIRTGGLLINQSTLSDASKNLTTGTINSGNITAPIMYDSGSSSRYVDPASTSVLNSVTVVGTLNADGSVADVTDRNFVEIYVYGSSDTTYYPVVISSSGEHYAYQDYSVSRRYNWTAPASWNTSTHQGALTLTWQHSGDTAWGGNDKDWRVIQFDEVYTTICNGLSLATTGGMVVWLRGGGSTGARYRIQTPRGSAASINIYDGTTSGVSGGGTHQSSTTFTAGNGTSYQAESYSSSSVTSRLKNNWPVRDKNLLYNQGNPVIDQGGTHQTKSGILQSNNSMRAPIFYDSSNTDFYIDPVSNSKLYGVLYLGHTNSQVGNLTIYDTGNNALEIKGTGANSFQMDLTGTSSTGQLVHNQFEHTFTNSLGGLTIGKAVSHTDTTNARITSSSGTLYIDSALSKHLYLGWYSSSGYDVISEMSARFPRYRDRNDTQYLLDPSNTGTSLNIAGGISSGDGTSANWKQAYDNYITGVSVSGSSTKTITLTQRDGGTLTANWTDLTSDTNNYVDSISFSAGSGAAPSGTSGTDGSGVLTLGRSGSLSDLTVDLDNRYLEKQYMRNWTRVGYGNSGTTLWHKLCTITINGSYKDYSAAFYWTDRYDRGEASIHVHSDNDNTADVWAARFVSTTNSNRKSAGDVVYTKSGSTVEVFVKTPGWREFDYIRNDAVTEGTPQITWYDESSTTEYSSQPSNTTAFTDMTPISQNGYNNSFNGNLSDRDNTTYYLNPAGTSKLYNVSIERGNSGDDSFIELKNTGYTGNITSLRQNADSARAELNSTERSILIQAGSGGSSTGAQVRLFANQTEGLRVVNGGHVEIPAILRHIDDTDTYMQFTDGEIDFFANGRNGFMTSSGGFVVNPGLHNYDFIVRGDNESNLIYGDASTDRVGIGTATPSYDLDIVGASAGLRVSKSANDAKIISASSTAGAWFEAQSPNYYSGMLHVIGGTEQWALGTLQGQSQYTLRRGRSGAIVLTALTDGKVGINNNSPQRRFVVTDSAGDAGDNSGILSLTVGSGANTDSKMQFGINSSHSGWIHVVKPGSNVYPLILNPTASSNGKVGIGDTSPSEMLDVYGKINVQAGQVWDATTQGTGRGTIHLDPNSGTDHAGGAITFGASDTSNGTNAHAGIYVRSDGSYGTRMYLSTTDSYGTGSKSALAIEANGVVKSTRTRIESASDMRATIFYDKDSTSYYLDAANTGTSLNVAGNSYSAQYYTSGWFRNNDSGDGLYNQATGQHWYSDHDDYWNIAGGGTANGIRFRDDHASTVRGYVYADNGNNIGFLDASAQWAIRHSNDSFTEFRVNNVTKATIDNAGIKLEGDLGNGHQRALRNSANLAGANLLTAATDIARRYSNGANREFRTFVDGNKVACHYSQGVNNSGTCYQWISTEWVDVDPEKDYEYSIWVQADGDHNVYMGWHERNASGSQISSNPYMHTSTVDTNGGWVKLTARLKGHRTPSGQADSEGTDRFASDHNYLDRGTGVGGSDGVMHSTTRRILMRFGTCYGTANTAKTYFYLPSIREISYENAQHGFILPNVQNGTVQAGQLHLGVTHWNSYSGIEYRGVSGSQEFRMSSDSGDCNLRVDGWGLFHGSEGVQAGIFKDINNAGYYVHPDGASVLNGLTLNSNLRVNAGSSDYTGHSNVDETILRMQTDFNAAGDQNLQFVNHNGNWLDGTSGSDTAYGWMWGYGNSIRAGIHYDHRNIEKFDFYSSYGDIRFRTPASANGNISPIGSESSMPERLTIKPGGNVGINKSNPGHALDITGTTRSSNDFRAPIFYDSNDTTYRLNPNAQSVFANGLNSSESARDGLKWHHGMGPDMIIWGHGDAVGSGNIKIYSDSDGTIAAGDKFIFEHEGNFFAHGDVTAYSSSTASDIRLKENIRDLEGSLDKTLKLRGVKFDWKDEHRDKDNLGFIAQEVEKIVPEVVKEVVNTNTNSDNDTDTHKVVQYASLVPMLVEAIKELKDEIDDLRDQLSKKEL